jgi:hypothetical protein
MALLTVIVLALFQSGVFHAGVPSYDLRPVSRLLASAQAAGHPVANLADYHGQFHFYGRLHRPVIPLPETVLAAWGRDHPAGLLVTYYGRGGEAPPDAVYTQPYRGGSLAVREGASVAASPDVLP